MQALPLRTSSLQLKAESSDAHLLAALHPTPAVCGRPREDALGFLAASEPFDRGYYAGPFGWVSQGAAEFVVAIRSALVRQGAADTEAEDATAAGQLSERLASHAAAGPGPQSYAGAATAAAAASASWPAPAAAGAAAQAEAAFSSGGVGDTQVSLFAGVGIVRGSDTASEWAELDLKIRQYERLLQGVPPLAASPNVNALWARLLVEELCRLGCNTFCVAPGEWGVGGGCGWCQQPSGYVRLVQRGTRRQLFVRAQPQTYFSCDVCCPPRAALLYALPGSRSSPLTVAVAQHPRARIVPCIGEPPWLQLT